MLGWTITDAPFHRHPDRLRGIWPTGGPAQSTPAPRPTSHAASVRKASVFTLLSRGEVNWRGRQSSILPTVGGPGRAIYLQHGMGEAREVMAGCHPLLDAAPTLGAGLKTSLQERSARAARRHTWSASTGPDR